MTNQMRAVFSIVDYSKRAALSAIYKDNNVPVHISTHGQGSADSDVLEMLGFGENKKSVMISLLSPHRTNDIFKAVDDKMHLSKPGTGIMFSVPVTSATAFISNLITKDDEKNAISKESDEYMAAEHTHELIVTIITKGFFHDVKVAANSAGARGGTLIHALGMGGEEAQKFLGIAIQPEKDVILMVVNREDKTKVMTAIAESCGINTEGRGIIFSLPVDSAFGLSAIPHPTSVEQL